MAWAEWVTEQAWSDLDEDLRRGLLAVLPRDRIIGEQAGNIIASLRQRGEIDLARLFERALDRLDFDR